MNVRITNLLINSEITLTDVKSIQVDSCELSIRFNKDHKYKDIDEILDLLARVLDIGGFNFHTGNYNYHFRGTDFYGNYYPDNETDLLLAVNPKEDIRYRVF